MNQPQQKLSRLELKQALSLQGFVFHDFSLVSEGNYQIEDVHWNYRDVPHLKFCHGINLVNALIDENYLAMLRLEKLGPFHLPVNTFTYHMDPSNVTYYTTVLFYALIVETNCESLVSGQTRVVTTYSIGSKKLYSMLFPVIRWFLTRGYRRLMKDDIPMRERRGRLREWGYHFDSKGSLSLRSIDLTRDNVCIPPSVSSFESVSIPLSRKLPLDGELLLGKNDHLGLRVVRKGNELLFFPRTCLHEGASLDSEDCKNRNLRCPWHGRIFNPITSLQLKPKMNETVLTSFHKIHCEADVLSIVAHSV